jgi:hypothetical protein
MPPDGSRVWLCRRVPCGANHECRSARRALDLDMPAISVSPSTGTILKIVGACRSRMTPASRGISVRPARRVAVDAKGHAVLRHISCRAHQSLQDTDGARSRLHRVERHRWLAVVHALLHLSWVPEGGVLLPYMAVYSKPRGVRSLLQGPEHAVSAPDRIPGAAESDSTRLATQSNGGVLSRRSERRRVSGDRRRVEQMRDRVAERSECLCRGRGPVARVDDIRPIDAVGARHGER